MKTLFRWLTLLLALSVAGLLAGCEGAGNEEADSTLRINLTDAPACGMDAVNVTITGVRVHRSASAESGDSDWIDIPLDAPRKINLLDLNNGIMLTLGQAALPSGSYSQVRLVLDTDTTGQKMPNSVRPSGTATDLPLVVPSGLQTGIKLVQSFTVPERTLYDLTLDFDACRSVVQLGNQTYHLKPVIRVVPNDVSGTISGFVDAGLAGPGTVISAQMGGVVAQSTVPDPTTGAFTLAPLLQTSTSNYDVVIRSPGYATSVVRQVPVTARQTTRLSTQAAPIYLNLSAEHSISGTITPLVTNDTAVVQVSQTVDGSTLFISSSRASAVDGSYQVTLPIAPVLRTTFGLLPLTFQPADSGGAYAVNVALTGYGSVTGLLDLNAGDITRNYVMALP